MKIDDALICFSLNIRANPAATPPEACRLVEEAISGGADIIHIDAPRAVLSPVIDICRNKDTLAILSADTELAASLNADGVFLGAGISDMGHARSVLGPSALLSVAAATATEAVLAIELRCDYLVLSAGEGCRQIASSMMERASSLPIFASGFRDFAEAERAVESGMVRLCIESDKLDATNMREEVASYSRLIGRCI